METIKPPRAPQGADKYLLRLPEGMRDRIAESAKANNRSMNAEIVARLESSYEPNNLTSLSWPELFKVLRAEAKKLGATISINIK